VVWQGVALGEGLVVVRNWWERSHRSSSSSRGQRMTNCLNNNRSGMHWHVRCIVRSRIRALLGDVGRMKLVQRRLHRDMVTRSNAHRSGEEAASTCWCTPLHWHWLVSTPPGATHGIPSPRCRGRCGTEGLHPCSDGSRHCWWELNMLRLLRDSCRRRCGRQRRSCLAKRRREAPSRRPLSRLVRERKLAEHVV
jgi:hypothetical protein